MIECPNCHKTFASPEGASFHMTTCVSERAALAPPPWVTAQVMTQPGVVYVESPAMSRRDHFAAAALTGLLMKPRVDYSIVVEAAVAFADDLIAELDKVKP